MKYDVICPQCKSGELIETNDFPQAKIEGGAPRQCNQCHCKMKLRVYDGGFADVRREVTQ